eukprot:4745816-Prymnesium_polylepis.1
MKYLSGALRLDRDAVMSWRSLCTTLSAIAIRSALLAAGTCCDAHTRRSRSNAAWHRFFAHSVRPVRARMCMTGSHTCERPSSLFGRHGALSSIATPTGIAKPRHVSVGLHSPQGRQTDCMNGLC